MDSTCPTCGAPVERRFCPECGEKRFDARDLSLAATLAHFVEAFTSLDGKVLASLKAFVVPGRLTQELLRGARVRYLKPIQLFLLVNVVYFFVQPYTGWNTFNTSYELQVTKQVYSRWAQPRAEARRAELGLDAKTFAERFDGLSSTLARSLVVLFVLWFAVWIAIVCARIGVPWGAHVSLGTELASFMLLALALVLPPVLSGVWSVLPDGVLRAVADFGELPGSLISLSVLGAWLAASLRRAYGLGRAAALGRAAIVLVAIVPALVGYRALLFVLTLYFVQ
ncbi:MAG: DUF3667 domain-containing protein [Planctomycetes bacterium]|nr:DUF3667 domain-containing protein [Planctomycetota bacterium]